MAVIVTQLFPDETNRDSFFQMIVIVTHHFPNYSNRDTALFKWQ